MLDYVTLTEREVARCVRLARATDHAIPLDHLPGWTVGEVVAHLAGDFRWATKFLTARRHDGSLLLSSEEEGEALCVELERAGASMVAAMGAASREVDVACPNFAEGDSGRLGWWVRHQLHETAMHRWDLEVPSGQHQPISAEQAADGIDELLHIYTRRYAPHAITSPVSIRCTDAGEAPHAWTVTPVGSRGRVTVERTPDTGPVDLEGPAEGLLLTLWNRLTADHAGVRWGGSEAELEVFLNGPLTA